MLMMVKSGARNLGDKALYRLEQVEREAAERRATANRVVEGLLSDRGTAGELIAAETRKVTKLEYPVEYLNARAAKSLPRKVTLWKPTEDACAKLRELFAQTLDATVVLLACLPQTVRSEEYLNHLTPDSRVRLTNGAMSLVVPDWRTLVAGAVTRPGRNP
jgi:hypothetical protein